MAKEEESVVGFFPYIGNITLLRLWSFETFCIAFLVCYYEYLRACIPVICFFAFTFALVHFHLQVLSLLLTQRD